MSFLDAWLPRKWQTRTHSKPEQYEQDVHALFNTIRGQAVLDHWLDEVYCTISHVPGDAYSTAYNEGQRAFIHGILETLRKAENKNEAEAKVDDGGSIGIDSII